MENHNISNEILQKLEDKFQKINQKNRNSFRGTTLVKANYLLGLYSNRCALEPSSSTNNTSR